MGFPKLISLSSILFDEETCISWLFQNRILDSIGACEGCGGTVRLGGHEFHCQSRNCRRRKSIFSGSFFSRQMLPCNQVMLLSYFWLGGCGRAELIRFTGHSPNTATAYVKYFRQVVCEAVLDDNNMVGGEGIIVEIDESKFGKRKNNRGHPVEGVWVVGGVERTYERRFFAETVTDRSATTLMGVITRHVRPGSIIHTDLWRGYIGLELLGFIHKTVNHSLFFVGPDGVHTNTIEGCWNGVKLKISVRNRNKNDMDDCLLEFIWRRKNKDDLWGGFIEALKNTLYTD
jgi:transposase-like protein